MARGEKREQPENVNKILSDIRDSLSSIAKQLRTGMSLWETRFWNALFVLAATGILYFAFVAPTQIHTKEYDYSFSASPARVQLNENGDISFMFNVTNIGNKTIKDFKIYQISLYRPVDGSTRSLLDASRDYLSCDGGASMKTANSGIDLEPGETCTVTHTMYASPQIFDDKDKPVYVYIYVSSSPPLENKAFQLEIY